ncbi:MAG: restriction endonuclease subunit S [Crocinitomicaceae bacterium]
MSDWIVDQLSAICEIEYGTRVVRKKDAGTKFPVYGGGGATFSMDTYNRENRMVVARFAISEKCTRFVKGKFFLNDSGLTLNALDKEAVNERFLNYQILSLNDEIYSLGRGTAQKNLNMDAFRKITLTYPKSLTEQKQIVSILDNAFEKIEQAKANIEKNIENAKELFQSELNEIFAQKGDGWEKKTLGDVCEKTKNINWKDYTNEEFEYIDLSSVSRDTLLVTETTMVNKENAPSRAKRIIQKGDVIFATTRPTLKRATIITSDLDGQICSTGFVVLRPKKNINSDWIFFYLLTSTFMDRMESLQRGASYPAVTDSDVKDSTLSIPLTKELEDSIVTKMNNLRRISNELVLQYLQKLSDLDELKKSILQKAFAGELTNKTVEA